MFTYTISKHFSTAGNRMDRTSLSILRRADAGSENAWARLDELYKPLIYGWLRRHAVPQHEAQDLAQEVMLVVLRKLPQFDHSGRTGAFRGWLRSITANMVREHWRAGRAHPTAIGGSDFGGMIRDLEDPQSDLSRQWDREHDRHVVNQLLQRIVLEFKPRTRQAFHRNVLDGIPASEVAMELGISVQAVYIAKSRIMRRLRAEVEELNSDFRFR